MKRRNFVRSSLVAASALAVSPAVLANNKAGGKKELYELREYEIHFGSNQDNLHQYLEKALIPALNKFGVKHVGVFKEIGKTEPAKVYVLIVYPSWEDYLTINNSVKNDDSFKNASAAYNQLPPEKPLYNRIITSLLIAFDGMPSLVAPAQGPRIFEMRTYEAANEDALRRKLKMFNESEFQIFDRTKLNRVFFGEKIAGKNCPCLTYMVTFKDMTERDANWAAFSADPDWKKVSSDPQYANNVSNIIRVFVEPTPYSQI
jgi:hypothetical protein